MARSALPRWFVIYGIAFLMLVAGLFAQEQPAENDNENDSAPTEESGSDANVERENPDETAESAANSANPDIEYGTLPVDSEGNPVPLSMSDTIRLVLDNNTAVRIQQLQILKSDTPLLKDEAQYSPVLEGGYESSTTVDKKYPGYNAEGNVEDIGRAYAKFKKLFSTGTYFEIEASDTRYDTNRNEADALEQYAGAGGDPLRPQRPLHTGALTVVLQQELLKNAFGHNQRRLNEINRNRAEIDRQNLIYDLTGLVVRTMITYWELSIAEENVRTSEELLANTRNIRGITIQKRGIGLAEGFEVNQWNALLAQAEIRLDQARLDRNSKRRSLLREMNLDPEAPLTGATDLYTDMPSDLDAESDLQNAYATRPDFKSITLQMDNARRQFEIAENQLLPSVTIGGRYSGRDFGRHANTSWNEVPNNRYPEYGVEFKVEYPLWNEDARVDARNARIDLRALRIQEEQLRRQIRDEIHEGLEQIEVSYRAMQNARNALEQTRAYYNGLVYRYRQGRFTAVAVKEALDALVQARQSMIEATINFNIALIRYDLIRNSIFVRHGIDIESVIDRMRSEQEDYEI
ncbi:MAG: TolC family protein [Leptospiraceae bacterium]|nr:TolC family protein [Leptospiraceae bacterium]